MMIINAIHFVYRNDHSDYYCNGNGLTTVFQNDFALSRLTILSYRLHYSGAHNNNILIVPTIYYYARQATIYESLILRPSSQNV